MGGEAGYDAVTWSELTGDRRRRSMLLRDSPHVKLLEQYRVLGDALFGWRNFEQTQYFRNAANCVRYGGHYFGHKTPEGITVQARAFVLLYERIANADRAEVQFAFPAGHSGARLPGCPPVVRETPTPCTFRILDGHHRLAIAWVLGQCEAAAAVLAPPLDGGDRDGGDAPAG